eukprot:snap_masked-scaffold_1-processed-gene-19.43-mRNA-1 protein AED:1.00 eAED:1.00 QI:0/-1/0/0/-1/1/1/0/77
MAIQADESRGYTVVKMLTIFPKMACGLTLRRSAVSRELCTKILQQTSMNKKADYIQFLRLPVLLNCGVQETEATFTH